MREKSARVIAVLLFATGIVFAIATGLWWVGALIFSAGAIFLGIGTVVGGGDRAVGMVMVFIGCLAVLGVVFHMLTGT